MHSLIYLFAKAGCDIFASKDAHSLKHCSFTTNGGGFPPHCVRGTKGAEVNHCCVLFTSSSIRILLQY